MRFGSAVLCGAIARCDALLWRDCVKFLHRSQAIRRHAPRGKREHQRTCSEVATEKKGLSAGGIQTHSVKVGLVVL